MKPTSSEISKTTPSPNGENGRDLNGRFTKGNPGGPGNPYAKHVSQLRKAFITSITEEDIKQFVTHALSTFRYGNLEKAKFLFSYLFGPPASGSVFETDDYDQNDVPNILNLLSAKEIKRLSEILSNDKSRELLFGKE